MYNEVSKDGSGKTRIETKYVEYTVCSGHGKCIPGYENIKTKDLTFEKLQEIFTTRNPSIENTKETKTYNTVDTRKLVNVSAGEISATSTDAVNGSQLYELDQKINAGASSPYLSVNATNDIADPQTSAKARGAHSIAIGENAIAAEKKLCRHWHECICGSRFARFIKFLFNFKCYCFGCQLSCPQH